MKLQAKTPLGAMLLLAAGLLPACLPAATIPAHTSDARYETNDAGVPTGPLLADNGQLYIGREYYASGLYHYVAPFQLPDLGPGTFSNVSASFRPTDGGKAILVNLFAIEGSRADSATLATDVNDGIQNHTTRGTLIQGDFWNMSTPLDTYTTTPNGGAEAAALATWLNNAYQDGGNGGGFVFMRLSPKLLTPDDVGGYNDYNGFNTDTANSGIAATRAPYLTYTFTPVDANLPVINTFTANPATISQGASSTLSWSVTSADTVSIDNGVGTVTAGGGTTAVSPSATTTYTLSATNGFGTAVKTTTVTVSVPQPLTLAANTSDAEFNTNRSTGAVISGPNNSTATALYTGRRSGNNEATSTVIPFQLPSKGAGGFTNVRLYVRPSAGATGQAVGINVNLFGIPDARSSATTLQSDVNDGVNDHRTRGALIKAAYLNPSTVLNTSSTNTFASTDATGPVMVAFSDWLTEVYANGENAGKYVFLRLSPESLDMAAATGLNVASQNNSSSPSRKPYITCDFDAGIVGPPSITFTANPTGVLSGGSSTLTWSVVNADTISIDNGIDTVAPSGSLTVTPSTTTTYTITATGPKGTRTKTATVAILEPGPFRYYRFVPVTLRTGGNTVQIDEFQMLLSGTRVPAVTVTNPGGSNPPTAGEGAQKANDNLPALGGDPNNNSKWLDNNKQPLVYDFGATQDVDGYRWCTGNDSDDRDPISWRVEGSHDNVNWQLIDARTNYTVPFERNTYLSDFPITSFGTKPAATFSATPTSIMIGESSTLTWNVTGADTISIDNGIGTVSATGSQVVSPTTSQTYTLSATNAQGTTTKTASVNVVLGPPQTYGFDDQTFQGWTDITVGPPARGWTALAGAGPGGAYDGSVSAINALYHDEGPHPTLVLRSPMFTLNNSGDLTAWLNGGNGTGSLTGTAVSALQPTSTDQGFMGIALRNVNSGLYVLSASKPSDNGWEQVKFTAAQLAALDQAATYTLDFIDACHGSWGWVTMDKVSIPGNLGSGNLPVINFSASPTKINNGESSTLAWSVTNATGVSIDNGVGTVAASGSLVVSPTATTTYTLTATAAGGYSTTSTATVAVRSITGALPIYTFEGTSGASYLDPISNLIARTPTDFGEQTTPIAYDNNFANNPELPGITGTNDFSILWLGWFDVTVEGTGYYTFGTESDDGSVIYLDLNEDGDFNDAGELVVDNNGTHPKWSATGTVNLQMNEVRIAIGFYQGGQDAAMAARFKKGNNLAYSALSPITGNPPQFKATNSWPLAPTLTFSASPAGVLSGEASTLSWTTTNATTVSIDNGVGTVAASGSVQVYPTATTTYTLTAIGDGGTRTKTAQVAVVAPGPFRYYRFVPTQLRNPGDNSVQLAEFQMLFNGTRLGGASASNPGGNSPGDQSPLEGNDNNLDTKWLDFTKYTPLVLDFGVSTDANGYRWATADDSDGRDPLSWRVEGSHDGTSWLVMDTVNGFATPTARKTYLDAIWFGGTPVSAFEAWATAAGLPPEQAGPEQTPQNDGVSNLMKFACNLDPTKPDVRRLNLGAGDLAGLPDGAPAGGVLRLEFLRRKASTNPGITYTPQFGASPGTWDDFTGVPTTVTSIDSTWERVVVDDPVGGATRFGRVMVVTVP
ncbi:MAG: hypothetical protein NTW21_19020 [Verrucomicrobia bacterium]|nr:hypothetical protein [Verrucomicrobiota bacterium]